MMWNLRRLLATVLTAIAAGEPRDTRISSQLPSQSCSMAEFACRSEGQCVPLDHYCNGVKDCDDGSDEPPGCTPCNRTYYGRIGATYRLQIPRPAEHALPHFCQLTFIASGFIYGDLIMLSIEKFSLGRFTSHTKDGCPDGHMQIEELSRPLNKGFWCGTSLGTNSYYSESSAITIMLRVFNLTEEKSPNPALVSVQDKSVLLRISYRFLQRHKANLRYGVPYNPYYRGQDVLRTFCDKHFENCDKKNCKIQSPNFPGMYHRNLTCIYRITQTHVPAGKVPLIRVRQENPHLIYIKNANTPYLVEDQRLYLDQECHKIYDYLMIYDGNNTQAPLLMKACKGDSLSPITASGSTMLIVFKASPYDFPFQDSPRRKVFGFMLDIEVLFADVDSTAYVRRNRTQSIITSNFWLRSPCEWLLSSRGQRSGYIQAPLHSVLPNTTCIWRLLALPSEIVWFYFYYYRNIPHEEVEQPHTCSNTLNIHDGDLSYGNSTLVKSVCQADKFPLVCSGVHAEKSTVACSLDESYISSSRKLSISLTYPLGTIPGHIEFLARYEFVSKRQWGRPLPNGGPCDRYFGSRPDRLFSSPRDVFLYGRGGNKKLECLYVFRVESHQRILIRIARAKMGNRCKTVLKQTSKRYECSHKNYRRKPHLLITEKLWDSALLNRACICNVSDHKPLTIISYTNELRLKFAIPRMNAKDDFKNYYFEGNYEIVSPPKDDRGMTCDLEGRVHEKRHGNFTIGAGKIVEPCSFLPRLVTATNGAFLYMKIKGFQANEVNCRVGSRINVYPALGNNPLLSVCPEPSEEYSQVFSHGWRDILFNYAQNVSFSNPWFKRYKKGNFPWSRDLVVEYIGNYSGKSLINWVEVWQPQPKKANFMQQKMESNCPHVCPEIQACLPPDLWCDGVIHCPSGMDEGAQACGLLMAFPWASLLVGGALMASLVILLIAVIIHKISTAISRRRKKRSLKKKQKKQKNLPAPPSQRLPVKPTNKLDRVDLVNPSENDGSW